jgi:hypothetical protein
MRRAQSDTLALRRLMVVEVDRNPAFGRYYQAEKTLDIHRARIRYWWIKYYFSGFHDCSVGGPREQGTFKVWEYPLVAECIISFLQVYHF